MPESTSYDQMLDRITVGISPDMDLVIGSDEHGVHLKVVDDMARPRAGWTAATLHEVLRVAADEVDHRSAPTFDPSGDSK